MKKPSQAAKKAKAKELFTLSHKLLDAAKQLSEHHAAELRYNMQQALEAAKTAAQNDAKKLQETAIEVKGAYFKVSKEFHPDAFFRKNIGRYAERVDPFDDAPLLGKGG